MNPDPPRTSLAWVFVRNGLAVLVALVLAGGLHTAMGYANSPYYSKLLIDIAIAIVLAVSLNIVNGFTGQFSIGHAGFMALGAYSSAAFTYYGSIKWLGGAQPQGGVLSWAFDLSAYSGPVLGTGDGLFIIACLLGGLVAAVAGYVVGLPSLRLRGDYLAIVTLGFGEIARVLLQSSQPQVSPGAARDASWGELWNNLGGAVGFNFVPTYTTIFWAWIAVALVVVVALRIKYSSHGRAYLAVREDEIAAEAMGVNTTRYKVQAFVVSSFFAGLAGALYAHQLGSVNAGELAFMKSFEVIIIVVLGGMGSVSGAVLAAIILTILPEYLRGIAEYRLIVYALLLILMMIIRPRGLMGVREIWELKPIARLLGRR